MSNEIRLLIKLYENQIERKKSQYNTAIEFVQSELNDKKRLIAMGQMSSSALRDMGEIATEIKVLEVVIRDLKDILTGGGE